MTMTAADIIAAKVGEIATNANQQPGILIIHNIQTFVVEYMSRRGLELLGTTPEELRAMGKAYNERFFVPDETDSYMPKVWDFMERRDIGAVVSFFQRVRTNEAAGWSWYFTAVRLLACDADGRPLLLVSFACPVDVESNITAKVNRLVEENNFLRQHAATFARLTARERQVLTRLARSESSVEIAEALYIFIQTVNTHRRNLRQKLHASTAFELGQFARAFDLI